MNAEFLAYFAAGRNGAALLLCMGAISFVGSYALWQSRSTFGAMIWPPTTNTVFSNLAGCRARLTASVVVPK